LVSDGDRITAVGRFSSENERSSALEALKSRLASNNDSRSHPFWRWSDIAAIRDESALAHQDQSVTVTLKIKQPNDKRLCRN
jgi:hypothetical protein